ncbi:hypothetical protein SEEM5278_21435 [Salmonella enterica subsp. enterica serovar Montevideo str. CT_02035278]|nr:hypothetical protein SEEM5278_21435 [Salmonella enterica subsp. enterica serovar Montevideo str. CT_02035278]
MILFTGDFKVINDLGSKGGGTPLTLVFVKSAKAVAPISAARAGALARPPAALTCAPMYFIKDSC